MFEASDLLTIGLLVILEGLLSADNALVMAIMVLGLPRADHRKALRYGPIGGFAFRILATLLRPSEGDARILGRSVTQAPSGARRRLGVVFPRPSLDARLTTRESVLRTVTEFEPQGASGSAAQIGGRMVQSVEQRSR